MTKKSKYQPRFYELYKNVVMNKLQKQFEYNNIMQVPKIVKITLNMGVGEAATDKKFITNAVEDLTKIAGQKPIITKTKKSIAGFKIRAGIPIGCKVTLRGERMYEFLDRLVTISIPRIRDFRGFSARAFDGRGNYSLGFKEQIVFPEIDYDKIDTIRGLDVTITTTAKTDKEARELLLAFGFPLKIEVKTEEKA
jgi:large subunit ribosomal protein L5